MSSPLQVGTAVVVVLQKGKYKHKLRTGPHSSSDKERKGQWAVGESTLAFCKPPPHPSLSSQLFSSPPSSPYVLMYAYSVFPFTASHPPCLCLSSIVVSRWPSISQGSANTFDIIILSTHRSVQFRRIPGHTHILHQLHNKHTVVGMRWSSSSSWP